MDKRHKKYYNDHQSGGGYDTNRKNNFFVSIPRRNLDGHINRRGDSTYKNYLFQRSKYKNRNRRYNNYLDRSYSNSSSNYKRKRFYFQYERNQEPNINIKKEPNSMDDDKISSVSNSDIKMLGIKREVSARRTRSNSNKTNDKNEDNSDMVSDDDKTEENLEIDTTRSGASSKTVENLNTPLKSKSSLVKGIDEMSEDEKICNWLQNHQAVNESLNNFSSISSYEDIILSPKRKIIEDFDSAYSDNDSENLQLAKKSKNDETSETNNNNSSSSTNKTEIQKSLFDEDLGEDESVKDDASNKTSKHSNASPSLSSYNNTHKNVSGGKPISGKKYDIRNHKSIKMMQEIHSSISKFSNHIRKNPPTKTPDKPKECDSEKRKSTQFKRTTRSISLIEPKSPLQDRHRKSVDSKKSSEKRSKSRQSSVTSDRTSKSKNSRGKSIPPDKTKSTVEHDKLFANMPVRSEKSKTVYNNNELLNLLESCASVDEKPIKVDQSIIDITNDNDDNELLLEERCKAIAENQVIEVIEIDRDEKFIEVSSESLEIEIIDMTTDTTETSPKIEEVEEVKESQEDAPDKKSIILPEVNEKSEIMNISEENLIGTKSTNDVSEEIVNSANSIRNSSVIVDSRAIATPEKVLSHITPTPSTQADVEIAIEQKLDSNPIQQPTSPVIETVDTRSAIAIRVRDATSLGASAPISDEEADIITVLNSEVFKSIIDICYLFCSWYAMLESYVQFSKALNTEAGNTFNKNVWLILYEQLKNLVFRSTYENFESSIENYSMYSDDAKQLLFKKMYEIVRGMCKNSNTAMILTSEPWIENIITKCINKYKANHPVVVTPEGQVTIPINQIPEQHTVQRLIRTMNDPGLNRPVVSVATASHSSNHPISPRQNVIEINKSSTVNSIQSLKDIRITNMNYHGGCNVSGTTNPNIPVSATLHQKSVLEPQYNRRPELLNHLVNNGPVSRTAVQHNKSTSQQTPSSHQYASPYPIAARPSNLPATYIPTNSDPRFTVSASNTYYPPVPSNRVHQPPPYSNYVSYDPNSQYSHVQQQQYLNYQTQMRANHQQKQTITQVPTSQTTVVNSPYSSILRSSLQPLASIQPKPNSQPPQHTLHYQAGSYIPPQHGLLQQHNQQSPPQYQRAPIQSVVNGSSSHPSQVRNHLRNHIEMSTQQHVQHQTQQQLQQQQQQQQQQQLHNVQKKSIQVPPQPQGLPGHPLQRPVATYEIVHNPSSSDTQYQIRLANDLSSQIQQQSMPPSNHVTSTQERISPDSQTTRDTLAAANVGYGSAAPGGSGSGNNSVGGSSISQQTLELSSMVKSLVRESLRELWPQMQQVNLSEMTNQITNSINENKKPPPRRRITRSKSIHYT